MNSRKSRASGQRIGAPWTWVLAMLALLLWPDPAQAGGSGLNTLIVANQNSIDSVELANYYRTIRKVPPENLLRVSWAGSNVSWSASEFTNALLNPVLEHIATDHPSNTIHYVVLSMGFPYRIGGSHENSTTAALFYGLKQGSSPFNSYALSEARFAEIRPDTAPTNSLLTMMLTADTLEQAKAIVDRGDASDGSSPDRPAWLLKSKDVARNKRFKRFDNAIFNTRLTGDYLLYRDTLDAPPDWTNVLGCQLGLRNFSLASTTFVPGAIADNMTSFGGQIFESSGQTSLLEFIRSGASGSHGTVTEPGTVLAKFPDPIAYFYQARGFNIAECYYQSIRIPFQGLLVGDPLAAPWRVAAAGSWIKPVNLASLSGITNLCVSFSTDDLRHPIDQIDLFVDGQFHRTLTNIPPQEGNLLSVDLNGYTVTYEVPADASLMTVATGLAAELNNPVNSDLTRVIATAFGDRIELQSLATPLPAGIFEVIDANGTSNTLYMAAAIPYSTASTLSQPGLNSNGQFRVQFSTHPGVQSVLETSTNLYVWRPVLTNAQGGIMEYIEPVTPDEPRRFYRAMTKALPPTPSLRPLGLNESNQFSLQVFGTTNRPYVLQTSSNRQIWSDIYTNLIGDAMDYVEPTSNAAPARFYRTRSADLKDYAPLSVLEQTNDLGNILRVEDNSPSEIVVWSSTNGQDWQAIYTYAGAQNTRLSTRTEPGEGSSLTVHLHAAQPEFLASIAQGSNQFGAELDWFGGNLTSSSTLMLQVTKTNNQTVTLNVTNSPGNTAVTNFVRALVDAINTHPDLTSSDGIEADDIIEGFPGQFLFTLRPRSGGIPASMIQARLTGSAELILTPASAVTLNANQSDLRARNHLFISKGVETLRHRFDFDTTGLPDGHHVLTAVAYEGTHVHSQTLTSIPVVISNSPLQATLSPVGNQFTNSLAGIFDLEVSANTSTISEISLYSTGGLYASTTNESTSLFGVSALDLGIGTHPFHALVVSSDGPSYRSETVEITIVP